MPFDPVNPLERSLVRAATDAAHRPQFYKDLMSAQIFVIQEGPIPEESGPRVLQEGYSLKIRPVVVDGITCLPIFSSLQRLQSALDREAGYIALNAADLFPIIQGSAACLNPGSDFGKILTANEIAGLVSGAIWKPAESFTVSKDTQVLLGQPANYPHELADSLARLFKSIPRVKRAYLAQIFNPEGGDKPHTLIAIEASGDWLEVVSQAGLVAREINIPDPPLDFLRLTSQDGLGTYFKSQEPFYQRKLVLGLF